MARIVKEADYAARRKEILDVALRLMYSKGYEQMAIQDILDALKISKGAFYHYFPSKTALLEALIERIGTEGLQTILPMINDLDLPALAKLERLFAVLNRWKVDQKALMLAIMRGWYADGNAIVRNKALAASTRYLGPLLTTIIRQGVTEGVLTTTYPDDVAQIIILLLQGLGESVAGLILSSPPDRDAPERATRMVAIYADALERILGVPAGSLTLIDPAMLYEWVGYPSNSPALDSSSQPQEQVLASA